MVDKKIRIILDSRGARREADGLNQSMQGVGKTADSTQFKVNKLALAIGAVITSAALRSVATMVQDYQAMSERVQMATKSTEEFNMVQRRLNETANGTYRSLAEAQELYLRTSSALQSLGYDTSQTLDVIDSMSYAFVVNATSADKANSAIEAFGKSVSKGRVDADQWETILSAIPTIIDNIAAASGKTGAEIRALGASGKLALTDLTEGFRLAREENKNLADGMSVNLIDASVRTQNALTNLFVALEERYGVIDFVTRSIIDAAESMNDFVGDSERFEAAMATVGDVVEVVSVLIAARLTAAIVTSTGAFIAQNAAMLRGTVTMNSMGVVIARTTVATNLMAVASRGAAAGLALLGGPVGAAIIAASALIYFVTAADSATDATDELTKSVERMTVAQARNSINSLEDTLRSQQKEMVKYAQNINFALSEIERMTAAGEKPTERFVQRLEKEQAAADDLAQKITDVTNRINELNRVVELSDFGYNIGGDDPFADAPSAPNPSFTPNLINPKETDSGEREIASAKGVTESLREEIALRQNIAQIYRDNQLELDASLYQQQLAQIRIREAEELAIVQSRATEDAAQREQRLAATLENDKLTAEARLALKMEFDAQELLAEQLLEEGKTSILEEGKLARERLREQERQNAISMALGLGQQLMAFTQGQSKKGFEIAKKASLASAAIDGVRSALSAWRSGMETPGPWAPLVAAGYTAASLLKTGGLINQIKGTNYNSGGGGASIGGGAGISIGGGVSGGGSSIPSTAQSPELNQQRRIIDLRGVRADDKISVAAFAALLEEDGAIVTLESAREDAARRNVIGVSAR